MVVSVAEHRNKHVFEALPHGEVVKEALSEVRAVQLAQNMVRAGIGRALADTMTVSEALWMEYATEDNGFYRVNDVTHGFRSKVEHWIHVFKQEDVDTWHDGQDGMPQTRKEAEITEDAKRALRAGLLAKEETVVEAAPKRFRNESLKNAAVGLIAGGDGLKSWPGKMLRAVEDFGRAVLKRPKKERKNTAKKIKAQRVSKNNAVKLAQIAMLFIWKGSNGVLDQFSAEAHLDQPKLLDHPRIRQLTHFFADQFIAGAVAEDIDKNTFIIELMKLARADETVDLDLTVAYEVEAEYDEDGNLSDDDVDENFGKYEKCLRMLAARGPDEKGGKNMSMKMTALGLFNVDPERHYREHERLPEIREDFVFEKMLKLLEYAHEHDILINIDMEYFIQKDATFRIFQRLVEHENGKYADNIQMVFQCYLKDSPQDAREAVEWAKGFKKRTGKRVRLRVVKGANITMDAHHADVGMNTCETLKPWHKKERDIQPEQGVTPIAIDPENPESSEITQHQFIEIMKYFEANGDCLDLTYGSHNPDTIAHILQTWINNGEDLTQRMLQSLFGMYNARRIALAEISKHRAYVPYGFLAKMLAYMSRRFVELKKTSGGKNFPETSLVDVHDARQAA